MPYANPTLLFVDFQKSLVGTKVDGPYGLDKPGCQIRDLEMIWDDTIFPDDLSGRCLLLKLGLTFSMLEFSDEKARIRFVITLEVTGPRGHSVVGESQIARGDACATPGKGNSFSLDQYYGPIEPLLPGQLLILRVKAATLSGSAEIPAGSLGTNEFRAEVFRVG
jgi:hypothetical protein